jgi:cell division protein FtsB
VSVADGSSAIAPRREAVRSAEGEVRAQVGIRSYLVYLAVAFLLAVALSWSYTTTARLGFRINEVKTQIASLKAENEKLGYQVSGYESLARVEKEAVRLGMVRPEYVRAGAGLEALPASDSGAAGGGTDGAAGGFAGGGEPESLARIITLAPGATGVAPGDTVLAGATGQDGGHASLWDRFYRWLTGVSQAEAREWQ